MTTASHPPRRSAEARLKVARERAIEVAASEGYSEFVELVREKTPDRFSGGDPPEHFLRGVDHHLRHFIPKLLRCIDNDVREVFDFGCGTGSSSIALAMVFPEARFHGTDINRIDVSIAKARARLY